MEANKNQENVTTAFKTALKNARQDGAKLTQEKAGNIAMATIDKLFNDDGTPLKLNPVQRALLRAMFFPQVKVRKSVLKATLLSVGCTLDLTTEELLTKLLNPAAFEKELSTARAKVPVVDWSEMVAEDDESTGEEDENAGDDDDPSSDEEPAPVPAPAKTPVKKVAAAK